MVQIHNPYNSGSNWLRGNVHTHTTASDGTRSVEKVITDYQTRGYDFLAISDHDVLVDPDEYRDRTEITLLPAVEVSANGPHLHHLGALEAIAPGEDRQTVIDEIGDRNGMAILNHPNWLTDFAHWTQDQLTTLEGYAGIEIYNGLIESHPGGALATDRWDQLLSTGKRVWGFANDDSHRPEDVARAWNVVQVDDAGPNSIMEALSAGRFYASTGVTFETIAVDGATITVRTTDASRIRLISDHGVVQQEVSGPSASFRIPEDVVHQPTHTYVRVESIGRDGYQAWTQPFFLES